MLLRRIELADLGTPQEIAAAIHDQLDHRNGPIPVWKIARALDIEKIRQDKFDGFEGMLLTDIARSSGAILVNTTRGYPRARFTIAHELGHFLMEWHVLSGETGFTCQASDMQTIGADEQHIRQESEANCFAIELLAPPHMVVPHLSGVPDLQDAHRLIEALGISIEAAVRRMIELRSEPLAAVWSHRGRIRYLLRERGFPWLEGGAGQQIPQTSWCHRLARESRTGISPISEAVPGSWTRTPGITLHEQTRIGPSGHAVTLLWAKELR